MRITGEIATKCHLLEQMIEAFIVARNALVGSYRQYEAHVEALNLFSLTIRNVEGVIALAREDLALLPPAQLAARAAFESSVRAAWMMNPADPFDRETRWLAHLKTEQDYLRRVIKERATLRSDTEASQDWLNSIKDFRHGVASRLEARGYAVDVAVPHFRECLRSLGEERTYGLYIVLSQVAHATHSATWLYRSGGLGTERIDGEFVKADDWNLPLNICRFAFKSPALIILKQLGADVSNLLALVG